MNILYLKNECQRLISCNFVIPIGLNYTWEGNGGFAHLVEHLIFRGHPELTQYDLMQKIEGFGGIMNAFTDEIHTEIYIRVEERYLAEVVALVYEAIIMFDISEEDVKEETEIIELEESDIYIDELLLNNILEFGNRKTTGKFCKEELKEIYRTYYSVERWTLLIVGEVSNVTKKQLEKYITNKKGKIIPKTELSIPDSPKYERFYAGNEAYFVYYHPCTKMCDKMYMKIIKYLLTSGLSSHFYKSLVEEKGYTYQITFQDVYYDKAAFVIFFTCEEEVEEEVRAIFDNVFAGPDFIDGIVNEKIRRAINMTITEYCLKEESVSSLVQDMITSLITGRTFVNFKETVGILSRQSEEEIKEQIKTLLFADYGDESA